MSNNIKDRVKQSPPIDTSTPYDPTWVRGKTILITGGASGFGEYSICNLVMSKSNAHIGEGFFRKWAESGANVIIGDVNDQRGEALVSEVRSTTSGKHYYVHCDVTDWQSQVDFFHAGVKLSPTGGIDAVVANAGIVDSQPTFEVPLGLDAEAPPKPNFKTLDVNLLGVMYTAHLALFYLPRNPGSKNATAESDPAAHAPDRHLLLIGSVASLMPLPGQVQYAVSKHGVLGLFRTLRSTSFLNGVRVNLLCPYFIETPLIQLVGRLILAGGAVGKPEDVVEAGTRFMADSRIVGRALMVGPKIKISDDDEYQMVPQTGKDGRETAIWEAYGDDFELVEAYVRRFIGLMNQVEVAKGWIGWASDIGSAFLYPLKKLIGR